VPVLDLAALFGLGRPVTARQALYRHLVLLHGSRVCAARRSRSSASRMRSTERPWTSRSPIRISAVTARQALYRHLVLLHGDSPLALMVDRVADFVRVGSGRPLGEARLRLPGLRRQAVALLGEQDAVDREAASSPAPATITTQTRTISCGNGSAGACASGACPIPA
jgi:hypothetical protein